MDNPSASLREWIDKNLPPYLNSLTVEFADDEQWNMPVIEDFVLVVAVRDYDNSGDGVFAIHSDVPNYRIQGLLREASD